MRFFLGSLHFEVSSAPSSSFSSQRRWWWWWWWSPSSSSPPPRGVWDYWSYRGADKSLAQSGRKQATATKFSLLQATQKKKIESLSVQPGLRGSNDFRVGRKMAIFQLFFQSSRAKDLSAPLYISRFRFSSFVECTMGKARLWGFLWWCNVRMKYRQLVQVEREHTNARIL